MYVTGLYKGAYPVEKVNEDFFKTQICIDTQEQYNNLLVFEVHRTAINDHIAQLKDILPGQMVKVQFNLRSFAVGKDGKKKWFTNVCAWSVKLWTPQTADDFRNDGFNYPPVATAADPQFTTALIHPSEPAAADDLPF